VSYVPAAVGQRRGFASLPSLQQWIQRQRHSRISMAYKGAVRLRSSGSRIQRRKSSSRHQAENAALDPSGRVQVSWYKSEKLTNVIRSSVIHVYFREVRYHRWSACACLGATPRARHLGSSQDATCGCGCMRSTRSKTIPKQMSSCRGCSRRNSRIDVANYIPSYTISVALESIPRSTRHARHSGRAPGPSREMSYITCCPFRLAYGIMPW